MTKTKIATSLLLAMSAVCFGACGAADESGPGDDTEVSELGVQPGQFCGGFANLPCPNGQTCVDDPNDDCDPNAGGADCGGICKPAKKGKCNYGDPTKVWVSKSASQCMAIKFFCAEGAPFFDKCGCGCDLSVVQTPCGAATCGAGEYCCNESCGICAPEGGFCTQQFCGSPE